MECGERKNVFIKNDITRNIYSASRNVKAFKTLMKRTIAKETHCLERTGACDYYMDGDLANIRIQKHEEGVIWLLLEKLFKRGDIFDDSTRSSINKISSCDDSFIPKF